MSDLLGGGESVILWNKFICCFVNSQLLVVCMHVCEHTTSHHFNVKIALYISGLGALHYWPRCPLIFLKSQGQLALPSNCPNLRPAVGNVKISLSENIALLLHRHVDVPCSLIVRPYIPYST